jgi:hypothetical protein
MVRDAVDFEGFLKVSWMWTSPRGVVEVPGREDESTYVGPLTGTSL